MSRKQLQEALALNSRDNFGKRDLKPVIELKMIELTIPDKPSSRLQKYRFTQTRQSELSGLKMQKNKLEIKRGWLSIELSTNAAKNCYNYERIDNRLYW